MVGLGLTSVIAKPTNSFGTFSSAGRYDLGYCAYLPREREEAWDRDAAPNWISGVSPLSE